jgi:tetratricopeptide (TPR) repeat protein
MTDPLRSGDRTVGGEVPERDRDARVEELLLSGLDHYFAGQHELAINVWTRVLFLDRGHARARAYIERARSAIAERQREAEELIHTGIAAFQRGESDVARRLLTSGIERGAGTEEALTVLERIERLDAAAARREANPQRGLVRRGTTRSRPAFGDSRARLAWVAAGIIVGIVAATLFVSLGLIERATWLPFAPPAEPAEVARPTEEPLPVPSAAEVWVTRARSLQAKGRLREALAALGAIHPGDAMQAQAAELRAAIQRQLLDAGRSLGPDRASHGPSAPPAGTPSSVRQ